MNSSVSKSRYIHLLENRFQPLAHIESLFDDNRLMFHYNAKLNPFSLIEADYLLTTPYMKTDVYIFLAEHRNTGQYFCCSFFPKEQKDYTKGQSFYTMLYKEKIYLPTGLHRSSMNASLQKKNQKRKTKRHTPSPF